MLASETIADLGIDAIAVKPSACDVSAVADLPIDAVTIDYEGPEHVPDPAVLATLAESTDVRVTVALRADGFDPLGDDRRFDALPPEVGLVLVAGHPAYLDDHERSRSFAPRLGAAIERAADPWVGTDGVERLALASGATQFALLSPRTERYFRALRAAGFQGGLAVYAPVVLDDDEDRILDAIGDYVARRSAVRSKLPDDARTHDDASDLARSIIRSAARDYALLGRSDAVRTQVESLTDAGADHVVGYPAGGVEGFLGAT